MARAERDAPDLVILDVVMPRRSGFNVLKRLNMMPTLNPRVIMVTGNEDPRHRIYAEASGVDAYVQKPFDVDSVLDLVDGLLD